MTTTTSTRTTIRRGAQTLLLAVAVLLGALFSAPAASAGVSATHAQTAAAMPVVQVAGAQMQAKAQSAYGYISISRGRAYFNFGIPGSVFKAANNNSRYLVVGTCSAYLEKRLGLGMWAWWVPGPICDWAANTVGWKEMKNGKGICGQIDIADWRRSSVWPCMSA